MGAHHVPPPASSGDGSLQLTQFFLFLMAKMKSTFTYNSCLRPDHGKDFKVGTPVPANTPDTVSASLPLYSDYIEYEDGRWKLGIQGSHLQNDSGSEYLVRLLNQERSTFLSFLFRSQKNLTCLRKCGSFHFGEKTRIFSKATTIREWR